MGTHNNRAAGRPWVVGVAIFAVAALLIALVLVLNRDPADPEAGAEAKPATPTETSAASPAPAEEEPPAPSADAEEPDLSFAERRDPEDLLAAGPVDAPVTLIVFSDYQCPFCAQWSDETLPLMMDRAEAGDLRIEWRDVNIYGAPSERAARASYAAGLQGEFWAYHDALFAGGEHRSESELSHEALIDLAGDLDLDTERFATDMESSETVAQIEENAELGIELGAFSTPAFSMGGTPLVGAQPSQVFVDAFDEALAEAE